MPVWYKDLTKFILEITESYTPNTDGLCSPQANGYLFWFSPSLSILLYLVHALYEPEGDFCQKRKNPFPFYSWGHSHGNARAINNRHSISDSTTDRHTESSNLCEFVARRCGTRGKPGY